MKRLVLIALMFAAVACVREKKQVEGTYPNGNPKKESVYKGTGKNRELVKETFFYEDKKVEMTGGYKHAKRDGYWVSYYKNGNKWSEGYYKEGLNDGKRTTYYESGKVRYIGFYQSDKRVGKWQFFDEAGNLVKEVDYSKPQAQGPIHDTLGVQ